MRQSTGCCIVFIAYTRSRFGEPDKFWANCSRTIRHRYNKYHRTTEMKKPMRDAGLIEGEIGAWYRAKCRVSGCSLRVAQCGSHIRSIHVHSQSHRVQWRRRSPWQGVGPHWERMHPHPFSLRAEEASMDVCVCVILPLTWRQIDPFTSKASFSEFVLSLVNEFQPKYTGISPAKINAFFPHHCHQQWRAYSFLGTATTFSRESWHEAVSNRLTKDWWSVSLRVNAFLGQIDVPWSWCPAKMLINRKDQIAL